MTDLPAAILYELQVQGFDQVDAERCKRAAERIAEVVEPLVTKIGEQQLDIEKETRLRNAMMAQVVGMVRLLGENGINLFELMEREGSKCLTEK